MLADFNNDGNLDFATSGNLLALGNGNGTFQTPAPFVSDPPSSGFQHIAAGDLNNDAWADVVLTDFFNGFIYVLINGQKGGFTQGVVSSSEPAQIALADLDGDVTWTRCLPSTGEPLSTSATGPADPRLRSRLPIP